MCELLGMSSNIPATLRLSLMKLAEHGGLTGPHKDGWGVGFYEGRDVRLIKEAEMAADSDWIRFLADHDLRSSMIIAHVRRATMGDRSYRNTQPFARELGGRMHLFAHNGTLPGVHGLTAFRTGQFHPVGETDSERAFCALLEWMTGVWRQPDQIPSLEERLSVVCSFARAVRPLGPANFLYSDGDVLFAHGHRRHQAPLDGAFPPGLVMLQHHCREGEKGFVSNGMTIGGGDQAITLIASVPLSDDAWLPLGEGEVVAVSAGRLIARRPVES